MASIILSFVGNQDPESKQTREEGSIVTLIRHLFKLENEIKKVFLLHTIDTKDNAYLTKDWLVEYLGIIDNQVEIISVSQSLSKDPIDVVLATQEARKSFEQARKLWNNNDIFELNSSSGTPSMKTSWGILQASGYEKNTRLWQIRNPKIMLPYQQLVFENNVNIFKYESDLKVIKKQLQNYNYRGALDSLENSNLNYPEIEALLEYSYCRLAFDFQSAKKAIDPFQKTLKAIQPELIQNIDRLNNEDIVELLQEVYYKSVVKVKTKQYVDFLVLLFSFQENLLRFLVKQKLLNSNFSKLNWKKDEYKIRDEIQKEKFNKYLEAYRYKGGKLRLGGELNRIILIAILYYFPELQDLVKIIEDIENYCDLRNDLVHELNGVSSIENEGDILKTMRQILELIKPNFEAINPFNTLNEYIVNQLTQKSRG